MALVSTPALFDVASLDGEGAWAEWMRAQGGTPLIFGRSSAAGANGRFSFGAVLRLVEYVRTQNIAALYVSGLRASLFLRFMKPALKGAKLIHAIRWNPASRSRLDKAFRTVERLFHPLIDLYIANSSVATRTLVEQCGISESKVRVIYNGLSTLPTQPRLHKPGPPLLLTVANLSPRKGYIEYLDVISRVVETHADARFVFVGRDDMNGRVQRAIIERGLAQWVDYVGFRDDVFSLMSRASVLVVPSLWNEGCPTAVLEAMAHRVPVVAYALDGIPELVRDGVDGYLVPVGDSHALAVAIKRNLDEPGVAALMGCAGAKRVRSDFTLEACAARHCQVLTALIQQQ